MTTEPWGSMDWLVDDAIVDNAGLSLARMTVSPGQTSPAHRHPNCTEAIYVLAGRIEEKVDEAWTPVAAGGSVFVPKGAVHQTRNPGDEEAVMIIAHSEGARIYEEVEA
ncbi:MAG: cupin domain-containing protein [Pseudomonadota bacterium]